MLHGCNGLGWQSKRTAPLTIRVSADDPGGESIPVLFVWQCPPKVGPTDGRISVRNATIPDNHPKIATLFWASENAGSPRFRPAKREVTVVKSRRPPRGDRLRVSMDGLRPSGGISP